MSRPYIPKAVRKKVADDAQHRCGYCLTVQEFTAMPMQIEHLVPIALGGSSEEQNLWLSCPFCNGYKSAKVAAKDPKTDKTVPLYNPRTQVWSEHFRWRVDAIEVEGVTAIGRATVLALRLNNQYLKQARRRWVLAGWHPPK